MNRKSWPLLLSVFFCAIGAMLSVVLVELHVGDRSAEGILASACGGDGAGCDKVLASRWSVFPPRPEVEGKGAVSTGNRADSGVPVAMLGLAYFTVLGLWLALWFRPHSRWMARGTLAFVIMGNGMSIAFLCLMAFSIQAWCPFCLASHSSNFLILVGVIFCLRSSASSHETANASRLASGPWRRFALVASLIAVVCIAEWQGYQAALWRARSRRLTVELEKQTADVRALEVSFYQGKKKSIAIRKDDPVKHVGNTWTLVYFSDIECPACAKFDRILFDEILPAFNQHIRVVFKHFPIESLHKHAMQASMALEAARMQGHFWEMHDALLAKRLTLGSVKYSNIARVLGMDVDNFNKDMFSFSVYKRLEDDIKQGERLGVTGIPAVFLNGRRVDKRMRNLVGFWVQMARGLKLSRESRGLAW